MALSPRDRLRLHSLGLWDGLPDAQRRGLDVEPISGLTALAEGRLAASYSQEAKVVTARSRRGEVCVGPASPQVGAMDFQCAEHSRFCFAIRVGRRCQAKDVVAVLAELTSLYPSSGGSDPG